MDRSPLVFIGGSVPTILVHELVELVDLVAMPGTGFEGRTVVGFDPKALFAYVAHLSVASTRRVLLVPGMSLPVLTAVPFLVVLFHAEWRWLCAWVSMFNTALAAGDIYMFFPVATRVPAGHVFHSELHGRRKPELACTVS